MHQSFTVPVKGMHCRSCEMLLEEKIGRIPHVGSIHADYVKGELRITHGAEHPSMPQIEAVVREAGYEVGKPTPVAFLKWDPSIRKDLWAALFVFVIGYYVLRLLGIANLSIGSPSSASGVMVPLLVGLTAGISTCMALVGGLVLGISARHAEKHPEATPIQKFRPHLYFNMSRIAAFMVLGGVLGALGSVFQLSGYTLGLMTVIVGSIMLMMGLQLLDLFPWLERWKLVLPKSVSRLFGLQTHQQEYSHKNAMILGGLTFFLPCGFTQTMQLLAMTSGSYARGATIMGLFALGTAPGLLGVGGLTSIIKGTFARRFFKFAGLVVIAMAVFNISNGWRLTGWSFSPTRSGAGIVVNDPNVTMENGVQIVRMIQDERGYRPNKFTIRKGIPVKWVITSTNPYSCASSIVASAINVQTNLTAGENIIEFTPSQAGQIRFTCSMGMYSGVFMVVDEASGGGAVTTGVGGAASSCSVGTGSRGSGGCGCGGCGGGRPVVPSAASPIVSETANAADTQIIRTTYRNGDDIQPNTFTVLRGKPVRFEVDVKENGFGCMSTIMIPRLWNTPLYLEAGKTLVMTFTPDRVGTYPITCAMGVDRGSIIVQ